MSYLGSTATHLANEAGHLHNTFQFNDKPDLVRIKKQLGEIRKALKEVDEALEIEELNRLYRLYNETN